MGEGSQPDGQTKRYGVCCVSNKDDEKKKQPMLKKNENVVFDR